MLFYQITGKFKINIEKIIFFSDKNGSKWNENLISKRLKTFRITLSVSLKKFGCETNKEIAI